MALFSIISVSLHPELQLLIFFATVIKIFFDSYIS